MDQNGYTHFGRILVKRREKNHDRDSNKKGNRKPREGGVEGQDNLQGRKVE